MKKSCKKESRIKLQKKILLIGSNGFIGKNLSVYLKKFFSIYKLNRNVLKENRKNISCDISKKNELKKKFLKFPKFEYVINLSGQIEKNKSKMQNNIYEGNKNLIQIFKKTEAILIFFSTTLVYGHSRNYRNEKSIPDPNSDYAKIKVKTENLYNKTCKKFLILRIGNVYDDQLAKKGLLKNLIGAIKGDTTFIVNKLETVRNYIHIKDLIRIIKIIIDSKEINKTLNIGHQNISNKKMIKIFEKIFKKKIKTKNLRQSYFLDPNIKISSNLIKNKFSYKFKNKIENLIKLNK